MIRPLTVACLLVTWLCCVPAQAGITRAEALKIAQAYCNYQWEASEKNVRQGKDGDGVLVHTPNQIDPKAAPDPQLWTIGAVNTGVPYKWGGFDSLESFQKGIKSGKAAGDVYNSEKRRLGGAAVSSNAVGIDCSGFISRCWNLPEKQSTNSLPSLCKPLPSVTDLKPGDIMNAEGGHVILFAKWLDADKSNALFYEASPYSKVISSTYSTDALVAAGFKPWRYKQMVD